MAGSTWFITGASRGLGKALANALLERGENVVATARNPETLSELKQAGGDRVWTAALDVNDPAQIEQAVQGAIAHFGRIDVLVNNAGYGLRGAAEEATADQVNRIVQTNLLAPMALSRAVLPQMRQQQSGCIIQISSVGGQAAFPGLSAYHATKWGLEGFSESLSQEVAPFGIKVMIAEPGGIRTEWANNSMEHTTPLQAYDDSPFGEIRRNAAARAFNFPGNPELMANAIIDAASQDPVPLRLPLGAGAWETLNQRYETRRESLKQWEQLARSMDYPAGS